MSIIERSIRLPVTVTVLVGLVVIFGLISVFRVPVELTPNVDQPVVTVSTNWFGASPQEVVREVVEEQEEVLKAVSGLRKMTSQASEGSASIRLEFSTDVDKDAALNEVRDKLRQVPEYPEDVDEPVVEATDAFSRDYIAWILVRPIPNFQPSGKQAPGFDGNITKLGTFMDDYVKPVLERAEGVSEVNVLGGRESEMQVRVDLQRLASRGITVDRLTQALRLQNLDITAGTVDEGKRSTSIRVIGQYDDPTDIENTVVAYTENGAPVYVKDVAEVVLDFKKEVGFVRSEGIPTVAINIQRETGTNVLTVMENVKAAIREVNQGVFGPTNWGIELLQVYDQTVYINDAVDQASNNLLIGAVLAGVVLFLALRSLGATMVVMCAIPICVIGTFLGMAMFGRSLNVISLSGLTFAIGMGIDNAIVVLENIFRHREMGKDRMRAAIEGAQEVWGAIVAATLTNVAVFLPIVFIEEEAGQLFRDISIALTISFFFYLFVAPTVIPLLSTLFLRRMPAGLRTSADGTTRQTLLGRVTAPLARATSGFSELFRRGILWLTHGMLRRLVLVGAFVGVSTWLSFALIPPLDYLPTGNQNLLFSFVLAPPGYNVDEFREIAHDVESVLKPWWEVAPAPEDSPQEITEKQQRLAQMQAAWQEQANQQIAQMEQQLAATRQQLAESGQSEDQIEVATRSDAQALEALKNSPPPAPIDNFFFGKMFGNMGFMGASSMDPANVAPLSYLMQASMMGIPGIPPIPPQQASIFRTGALGAQIELSVQGVDNEQVLASSGAVMGALMGAFNTYPRSDPTNFNLGRPEIQLDPDRVRAAAAGVDPQTVRAMAQVAVDGQIIGDYRQQGRAVDLTVVTSVPREQVRSDDLGSVPLATRNGDIVTLASVADLIQTSAPQQINRVEEQPAVSFTVQLPAGMTIQEAERVVAEQVEAPLRAAGAIPPTVRLNLEGSADKLNEFLRSFIPGFALAALVTYLLLASLFENFIYPLVIILSVPFAMVGGFMGLAILHAYDHQYVLNVLTMLGLVILVGTIVNNPILIVHQALNFMREGMKHQEAIALSTQTRVRPIFMSVITSVAGMAPLVVFGGAGSELYRGLGAVLIGGLVLSTIFTLFLTPTLMSLLLDLQAGVKGLFGGKGTSPRRGAAEQGAETDAEADVAEPVTARGMTSPQT